MHYKRKTFSIIILAILLVGVIFAVCWVRMSSRRSAQQGMSDLISGLQDYLMGRAHDHGVAGQVINAKNEMKYIEFIIRNLNDSDASNHLSTLLMQQSNELASVLYHEAYADTINHEFSRHAWWDSHSALVDPWETPYNFHVNVIADSVSNVVFHIDIWSSGPNRVNERKRGDDVTVDPITISNQ